MKRSLILTACGALALLAGTAAQAADTTVTCNKPQIEVNTGQESPPRMTLHCLGGSSVAGINYFAFLISSNTVVAQMVQQTYQSYLQTFKNAVSVTVTSNLSDLSGNAWGCGSGNCRILDYAIGL